MASTVSYKSEIRNHIWCSSVETQETMDMACFWGQRMIIWHVQGIIYPGSHRSLRLNRTDVRIKSICFAMTCESIRNKPTIFTPNLAQSARWADSHGGGSKRGKCNWIRYCLTPSLFGQVVIPLRPALGPPLPWYLPWARAIKSNQGFISHGKTHEINIYGSGTLKHSVAKLNLTLLY